ncbi:MAG TPA: 4'-phosphopantetheinyl transferase superfamily protein, partial [Bacteroidia bacterium]|nr:4'-phosphopantetheinyl transferase superfamily protein [Bacteroidia bacterium]
GTAQNDYFYRLWTLKEAFFKATGTGISAGLEKIAFELADGKIHWRIAASLKEDNNNWQFHQWVHGTQEYCALAYKSQHPLQVNWLDALYTSNFS